MNRIRFQGLSTALAVGTLSPPWAPLATGLKGWDSRGKDWLDAFRWRILGVRMCRHPGGRVAWLRL